MAKKSNRKRPLSSASPSQLTQSEQTQSPPQHTYPSPHSPKTQDTSSAAAPGGSTLPQLTKIEELPPAVRCAHNVALLELLDPRPQILASLKPDSTQQEDEGRILSMRQERELATNLAFLAGVSSSPDHIMAVCIEELPGPGVSECQVMVSINQRRPCDGIEVLTRVQNGFEQIFKRLSAISAESSTQERLDIKETVLNDIIALCHMRILSRLRSKHSRAFSRDRKLNKRFVGSVLREFLEGPWQTRATQSGSPLILVHRLDDYQSVLRHLLKDLEIFEAADDYLHENLLRLVRSISQAVVSVPIKALLESLDNNDMDDQLPKWLHSCFTKVHRYNEVASILCHRARRIPMLRSIRVGTISNVAKMEGTSASLANIMNVGEYLARFQYEGETVQMEMLPEWLRSLAQSSMGIYSKSVRGILNEAKVHAEIQLLAHYENEHAKRSRPRILASSKKTCALCNAIITIHGGYEVPKSHGKLYKGWRLPAAHQNGALQEQLNVKLENSISARLAMLMPLSRRPRIDFENESSLFSFSLSESTLAEPPDASNMLACHHAAAATPNGDRGPEAASYQTNHGQVVESTSTEHATTDQSGDESEEGLADDANAYALEHIGNEESSPMPHDSILTDGFKTSLDRQPAVVRLVQGQKIMFSPKRGVITYFRSRRIELLIDETSRCFSFELLSTAEAEAVLHDETKPKTDVRTIACKMDVLLSKCASGQVYISHGKEVIRICARPG